MNQEGGGAASQRPPCARASSPAYAISVRGLEEPALLPTATGSAIPAYPPPGGVQWVPRPSNPVPLWQDHVAGNTDMVRLVQDIDQRIGNIFGAQGVRDVQEFFGFDRPVPV